MMRILYWDCFSGIAGNMAVASLLDAGADQEKLKQGLASVPFAEGPVRLIIEERCVDGIKGIYFNTFDDEHSHAHFHEHDHEHLHDHGHDHLHTGDHGCLCRANLPSAENMHLQTSCHDKNSCCAKTSDNAHTHKHAPHRGMREIAELVNAADISMNARRLALNCFAALAAAEAQIHAKSVEEVHFHEVGARDSIADIVGMAICLDDLGIEQVYVSPVHLGSGMVHCAHGVLPVPAPATALLLQGIPVVFDHGIPFELTTPTGAAILKSLDARIISNSQFSFMKIGHGHGSKKIGQANFLRAFIAEQPLQKKNSDSIILLETNIDNVSGEILGHAVDALMRQGAVDVCLIPVLMKKGRPGHILQLQVTEEKAPQLEKAVFALLPTLGLRRLRIERTVLAREKTTVMSEFGELSGKKIIEYDGEETEKIEFDEIIRIAEERKTSPHKIYLELCKKK